MTSVQIRTGLCLALAVGLVACGQSRKATESTGTATATVKTDAPANQISNSQLQTDAQVAADKASVPVANSMSNTTGNTSQ